MQDAARSKARHLLTGSRNRIQRLRAMGPNPFDYWLWADETAQLLETIFGKGTVPPLRFAEVVYERGRTVDQRGAMDNMTLGIHGEWGIRARLDRAEALLERIIGELGAGSQGAVAGGPQPSGPPA